MEIMDIQAMVMAMAWAQPIMGEEEAFLVVEEIEEAMEAGDMADMEEERAPAVEVQGMEETAVEEVVMVVVVMEEVVEAEVVAAGEIDATCNIKKLVSVICVYSSFCQNAIFILLINLRNLSY